MKQKLEAQCWKFYSHIYYQGAPFTYENLATSGQNKSISMELSFTFFLFSNPFSFSLRSTPGACLVSKGLMTLWILRWMLKTERNISLSFSVSQKIPNTRGSIQGMIECLTEAAICSQLANRDLFGQWAQSSTQQTPAFLLVHNRKNQTLVALLPDSSTTLERAFYTECLCPAVTIQWVPTAFLGATSVYSQFHSGSTFICKGLEENVMGNPQFSFVIIDKEVTECFFFTNQQDGSRKSIERTVNVMELKELWGGAQILLPLQSRRTPSITFRRKSEKRWPK